MYFDFDDRYSDVEPVGRAINLRDGVVVSVLVHAAIVAFLLFGPAIPNPLQLSEEEQVAQVQPQPRQEEPRFVFVQPKLDTPAPKPPARAELSDTDRQA